MWRALAIISAIMLVLDFTYFYLFRDFMLPLLKKVQKADVKINIMPAIACYLLMVSGLYYFILRKKAPIKDAILLGLLIYGVYETTNYAFFKDWSPLLVLVDTVWGGILFGTTTFLYYKIAKSKLI
uniref:DUF2177 family protein n=1 Tax=viral metagenome TaxID=1070528 RepID=A0A6C0KRI1_9ZZZZ